VAAAAAAAAVKPTVERHGAFRACVSKYSDATEKETGKDTGKERQSEGRGGRRRRRRECEEDGSGSRLAAVGADVRAGRNRWLANWWASRKPGSRQGSAARPLVMD
jgi:hypothetical protein